MKHSELKVVAVILAMTLIFTFLATNAVSVASIILLAKNDIATQSSESAQTEGDSSTSGGSVSTSAGSSASSSTGSSASSSTGSSASTSTGSSASSSTGSSASTSTSGSATTPDSSADTKADANSGDNADASKDSTTSSDAAADKTDDGSSNAAPETWSKEKAFNFYKDAAHSLATKGNAGYNKIEWQVLENLQVGSVGDLLQPVIDNFMTTKEEASVQTSEKGSDDAKNRFPDCTLTDLSKVVSAEKKDLDNGNYEITIIMQDEDTPMNEESSFLAKVTTSVLFWEDIERTIQEDVGIVKAINSRSVNYKGYKIIAEMTKDGKFVTLGHYATVDITANAQISVFTLDIGGTLYNNCEYTEFKY